MFLWRIGFRLLLCLQAAIVVGVAYAAPSEEALRLLDEYRAIQAELDSGTLPLPIVIVAAADGARMQGDVHGLLDHDFARLAAALVEAQNWCDIAPLHLNIKSCVYQRLDGRYQLTFYSGRKFYESPQDVYALSYEFRVAARYGDYIRIELSSVEGPLDTGNYRLTLEASPLGPDRSFVHFSYAYDQGWLTRMLVAGYFATLASDKIGFTVLGTDGDGAPVYVRGVQGVLERNAVRYYLAVQAYMDTLSVDAAARFEARIERWFLLTERFGAQLHELDRAVYLDAKRRERADQLRLQRQ